MDVTALCKQVIICESLTGHIMESVWLTISWPESFPLVCFREGSGAFMWTPRRNLMAVNVMFPRNVHAAESFTLCIILLDLSTNRPVPSCDFHGILSPSFNPVDLPPAHQLHLHWLVIKHKHWHSQASVCSEAWCVFHNTGVLAHALGQD